MKSKITITILYLALAFNFISVFGQTVVNVETSEKNGQEAAEKELSIGQTYQGGIIFKLDADKKHGLIVCKETFNSGVLRKEDIDINTFARVDGYDAHKQNTLILLAVRPGEKTEEYGMLSANNYLVLKNIKTSYPQLPAINSFQDWYLPSRYELNIMYKNLQETGVTGFTSIKFLNPADITSQDTWEEPDFNDADPYLIDNDSVYIRLVRSF